MRMQVSVIIPVKNGAATIGRAIQSVIDQHGVDWELLVMDGLSDDQTEEIVSTFHDPRIHFLSQKDAGVYSAMNRGILKATGEWIYIMGADDVLATADLFASILTQTRENDILVLGRVENVGSPSQWVRKQHRSFFGWPILFRNTVHQQGALYRRSWLLKHLFQEEYRVLADYDTHLQAYLQFGWKSKSLRPWLTTDLLFARCDASGISKQFTWSLYREELKIRRRRLGIFIWLLSLPIVCVKYLLKR